MKRFDRLEFDSPQEGFPKAGAAKEELHDEHHWLKAAEKERREGQFENALRYYSRALEINKSLVVGWLSQVQMLILLGEYKEAELWSRKALELFRKNGDLTAGRAQALARLVQHGEALKLSDASFTQEGQSAYRWIVRGEILLSSGGEVDQHCFTKAIQADPDWLVAVEIGQIYLFYRKPSRAILQFRYAVERAPGEAYCWYAQGCCELNLGMKAAAKKSFLQCLDLKPNHGEARRQLISLDSDHWSMGRRLGRFFGWRKE